MESSVRAQAEVLVIGGGIAGASTAYHLARLGHDIVLLERGDIASEASGVNAGSISAMGWGNVPDLNSVLRMGSLEIFKTVQLELGYDIEFPHSGSLQAVHTEEQYEFVRDRVLKLRAEGFSGVELLTIREARSIEPEVNPDLLGFMYSLLSANANPLKATRAFGDAARRAGARILTGHQVTGINYQRTGEYLVTTPNGPFLAGSLVIAAGAWCEPVGSMLVLRIPVVPVRGQMWATESLPPRLFHVISSVESAVEWSRDSGADTESPPFLTHRAENRATRHLYGRQTRDGEIVFGGDRQLVGLNKVPDPAGIEVNRGHAAEVASFLLEHPIKRTWAGLMPFTLDGRPIIGRLPHLDNLYVVTGLGPSGFGPGPMSGKLLADYIHIGHMPHILAEADPARCVTLA